MKKVFALLVVPVLYFWIVGKFWGIYIADTYHMRSKSFLEEPNLTKAKSYAKKSVRENPLEPAYRRQLVKVLLAEKIVSSEEDQVKLHKDALKELVLAEQINPKNLATLRNSIPLYYFLSSDSENFSEEDFGSYLQVTKNFYSKLKTTYASDLGLLVDVAKYERKLGLVDDYTATSDLAKGLRKDITDWHGVFQQQP